MITANWSLVYNEGSFEKKAGYGFFIFNQSGNFSIVYSKPVEVEEEESRIDFYPSLESSPDKKSLYIIRIVAKDGKNRTEKGFKEITKENIWEVLSLFFDYSDLEKIPKSEVDRFLMGFSKGIKDIFKSDKLDEAPSSFKAFQKILKSSLNDTSSLDLGADEQSNKLENIIKSFVQYFRKN
jgi:hypothetical protein